MDDGKDSIATLGRLLERHAAKPRRNVRFVVVENLGRGKEFSLFDRSPARAAASAAGALTIQLPELHTPSMRKLDRSDGSFWAAVNNLEFAADLFTRMDRQRIKAWMVAVYDQLARLGEVA
jgi:hypothetical protein